MKYYYMRRLELKNGVLEDRGVVEIPEKYLEDTQKANPTWKIVEVHDAKPEVDFDVVEGASTPKPEPPKKEGIECPLCGRVFKNEHGLKIHKKTHV